MDPKTYQATGASTPSPGSSIPPPPPPPNAANASPSQAPSGNMGGVFASLNKGEGVTSGLKKVDKSEMTHKNPELRTGGHVPDNCESDDVLFRISWH